jgi:hypothetical protein
LLQQIPGRVAAYGQLGKDRQVAAAVPGLTAKCFDFTALPLEIADQRVDLNECDFHACALDGYPTVAISESQFAVMSTMWPGLI